MASTIIGEVPSYKTSLFVKDDFIAGSTSAGTVGELGWGNITATGATYVTVAGHPGVFRLSTSNTTNSNARMTLNSGLVSLDPADFWDWLSIASPTQVDANTQMRIGLSSGFGSDPPSNGIYFERLTSDTNWFAVCRSGGTETRTDTTVACTTAYKKFRIRRKDASTISFSIDGGSEIDITTNIPTTGNPPAFQIVTTTTATKTLDIDYMELTVNQLSR